MSNEPDIKSEYYVDKATGQRYLIIMPGGTVNAAGEVAGNMVVEIGSDTANAYNNHPSKVVHAQWAFGQDDGFETLTTSPEAGFPMDARHINTAMRSILVLVEGTTANYTYELKGGRNNDVAEAAVMIATGGAVTEEKKLIDIPASLGYAPWLFLSITPTGTGDNLNFKAALLGRGA